MASQHGVCKWFDGSKGFGFLVPSDGSRDVFVHASDLSRSGIEDGLKEGEKVSFDTETGRNGKGPKAVNISRA